MPPRVQFVTRKGCCLCVEALLVVDRVRRAEPFELEVIDVDSTEELREDYGGYVPVVLVDGQRFAAYHLDEAAFLARLRTPTV